MLADCTECQIDRPVIACGNQNVLLLLYSCMCACIVIILTIYVNEILVYIFIILNSKSIHILHCYMCTRTTCIIFMSVCDYFTICVYPIIIHVVYYRFQKGQALFWHFSHFQCGTVHFWYTCIPMFTCTINNKCNSRSLANVPCALWWPSTYHL